jgi:hypothetical protein
MTPFSTRLIVFLTLVVAFHTSPIAYAEEPRADWKPSDAGKYMDEREKTWLEFSDARRGKGTEQTTCISCHSVLPYVLARPALRKLTGTRTQTEHETKLVLRTKKRVENWKDLDTEKFGLFYDFSEQKKKESWGTEAILNAVVLAFDDNYQGKSAPSDVTKLAFANLWKTQLQAGDQKGSWASGLPQGKAPGAEPLQSGLVSLGIDQARRRSDK